MIKLNTLSRAFFLSAFMLLALQVSPPISPANAQLPPEMQMDVLMTKLKDALKAKNNRSVLTTVTKLRGLSSDLPNSILFIEARAQAALNRNVSAKKSIESYLKKAGKDGKFYSEAIKLYVVLEEKVTRAEAAQAKKTVRKRKAQQAAKKKADKKRAAATAKEKRARAVFAAGQKRRKQAVYLQGHPSGFAKLPDGRFAVLGYNKGAASDAPIRGFWIHFYQANGKYIRSYKSQAPAGMKLDRTPRGLQAFPGGTYIINNPLVYTAPYVEGKKTTRICNGPLMFTGKGELLPRESYLPEVVAPFNREHNPNCYGSYLKISTAPDGNGIIILNTTNSEERRKRIYTKIYTLNSSGQIQQRRYVKHKERFEFKSDPVTALTGNKFVSSYFGWRLHQGVKNHFAAGSLPKKDHYITDRVALPSGGWSFLLLGKKGAWKTGIKGFSTDGFPAWHTPPSCRFSRRSGTYPASLWRADKSLLAVYGTNALTHESHIQCLQEVSFSGQNIRKKGQRLIGLNPGKRERVIGLTIDPDTGDRLFVIDVEKTPNGYLMRTNSKLVQKKW